MKEQVISTYRRLLKNISYREGSVREMFFRKMLQNSGGKVYYSKIGDFQVQGYNFKIGGKNKQKKQIQGSLQNSYLVKDDILYSTGNEIPLYLFGFLY